MHFQFSFSSAQCRKPPGLSLPVILLSFHTESVGHGGGGTPHAADRHDLSWFRLLSAGPMESHQPLECHVYNQHLQRIRHCSLSAPGCGVLLDCQPQSLPPSYLSLPANHDFFPSLSDNLNHQHIQKYTPLVSCYLLC